MSNLGDIADANAKAINKAGGMLGLLAELARPDHVQERNTPEEKGFYLSLSERSTACRLSFEGVECHSLFA
jgi:hypothetical protein